MLPEGFLIEPMQSDDIAQVMEIEDEAQELPWAPQIFLDCLKLRYQGYVLREQATQQIIGFSFFSQAADECHLLNFAIRDIYRRQGWAKYLLEYCLTLFQQENIKYCYLEVRESNIMAQSLYLGCGFKMMGLRKGYYVAREGHEDALVMRKEMFPER